MRDTTLTALDPEPLSLDALLAQTPGALLAVVVQDALTGAVLMAWFWSRSRQELWRKGATSGNTMRVVDILADCDADALLYRVEPAGPACHTGAHTCFFRRLEVTSWVR